MPPLQNCALSTDSDEQTTELKDAYICYNAADLEWVTRLAEQLESETIDGAANSRRLNVFFDKWDIGAGQSIIDRMNNGMNSARHVITVLSPEFLKADWPRFEWKHIVAQDPNNSRGRLIPILLRDRSLEGTHRIDITGSTKYFTSRCIHDGKYQPFSVKYFMPHVICALLFAILGI
jgi:hypothetical protein